MTPKRRHYIAPLVAILIAVFVASLLIGRYSMPPDQIATLVLEKLGIDDFGNSRAAHNALFIIRVPRNVGAMVVGAGLACAGAVFQGVFKNPMSSPDILGAATGAGFGAACGILIASRPSSCSCSRLRAGFSRCCSRATSRGASTARQPRL